MIYPVLIALHVLGAIVWVGGMVFMHVAFRPALQDLDGPVRLGVFGHALPRFFRWVWVSIAALVISGYGIVFGLYGGFATTPIHVHVMQLLGLVMMVNFAWMYFVPFRKLQAALAAGEMPVAANAMGAIRTVVTVNLLLGLITSIVGAAGSYWT